MTKAEAKRIIYDEANYWRRIWGRFAREKYQKKDNMFTDYRHKCRLVMYMRDNMIHMINSA